MLETNDATIRGWLCEIRNRHIMWANYCQELRDRGLVRFDEGPDRYVLTLAGEKFLATSGET